MKAHPNVLSCSIALDQIGDILVNSSKITGSSLMPPVAATQINDITALTTLLTDTTAAGIQAGILSAGQGFLDK